MKLIIILWVLEDVLSQRFTSINGETPEQKVN